MKKENIVPIAYSPFAKGQTDLLADPLLQKLAAKYNATTGQICLAWGLHHGCIQIPKTSNPDRLKENADALSLKLDEGDIAKINGLNTNTRVCNRFPWFNYVDIFA